MLRGHFVLASGRTSAYYIDARQVTLSARGSHLIGQVVLKKLGPELPDVVAGMSMGADPLISAVTVVSSLAGRPLDGLLIRKQAKNHGTARRVEGPMRRGMTAVVLEDTSTTGASALEAAQVLSAEGVAVARVITLIDREEGAADAVRKTGLRFDAIFGISEILAAPAHTDTAGVGHAEAPAAPLAPDVGAETVSGAVSGDIPPPSSEREARVADAPSTNAKSSATGPWVLHTDGSSIGNPGPAGAAWILYGSNAKEAARGARNLGPATSNAAEYCALIDGLDAAASRGVNDLTVRMDSELVVKQMQGLYRVKHPDLKLLHEKAGGRANDFAQVRFEYVPRERNKKADQLANDAARRG